MINITSSNGQRQCNCFSSVGLFDKAVFDARIRQHSCVQSILNVVIGNVKVFPNIHSFFAFVGGYQILNSLGVRNFNTFWRVCWNKSTNGSVGWDKIFLHRSIHLVE